MANSSIWRIACLGVGLLLVLSAAQPALAGTVSGRMAVGATVVSSCVWRTEAADAPLNTPTVVARCAAGVRFDAAIHAASSVAQAVRMARHPGPGHESSSSSEMSPAALRRDETVVPVHPPGWGDSRPNYITITY